MGSFTGGIGYVVLWFLIILTVLVFVHEFGHYIVARWNGVRVEVFSIGFGPELFGWNDRAGTRWKFSAVPLGGYVKMFGDADPASMPATDLPAMTEAERAVSFHHKRLPQRAAIVAAGPAANFIFAIVLLAAIFATVGQRFTPPDVDKVLHGSAAEAGGLQPGDVFLAIDGRPVETFEDVQNVVRLNLGVPMTLLVRRAGVETTLSITPTLSKQTDRFGNTHEFGVLGVESHGIDYIRRDPASALWRATGETVNISVSTLQAVWQMIIGARSTDELGGPLRIAQMSGEVAQYGFVAVLQLHGGAVDQSRAHQPFPDSGP